MRGNWLPIPLIFSVIPLAIPGEATLFTAWVKRCVSASCFLIYSLFSSSVLRPTFTSGALACQATCRIFPNTSTTKGGWFAIVFSKAVICSSVCSSSFNKFWFVAPSRKLFCQALLAFTNSSKLPAKPRSGDSTDIFCIDKIALGALGDVMMVEVDPRAITPAKAFSWEIINCNDCWVRRAMRITSACVFGTIKSFRLPSSESTFTLSTLSKSATHFWAPWKNWGVYGLFCPPIPAWISTRTATNLLASTWVMSLAPLGFLSTPATFERTFCSLLGSTTSTATLMGSKSLVRFFNAVKVSI